MENELFDLLQNMTVGEFVQLILKHEQVNSSGSKSEDVYYTAKELIQKYPNMFSKYKLDKYIKNLLDNKTDLYKLRENHVITDKEIVDRILRKG